MNPEIKAKWIAALRSGEFTQGSGALRRADTDRFCCLGVLCELYRRDTGQGEWTKFSSRFPCVNEKMVFLGALNVLPPAVSHWAGLYGDNNPVVSGVCLAQRNDDIGESFAEIADIIDAAL